MIGALWSKVSSHSPWRWIRAVILFLLAAWAMWSAQRHILGRTAAHRRRQAATTGKAAARHRDQAARLDQVAAKAKSKAEKRLAKLRERGHVSMAEMVENLNALD